MIGTLLLLINFSIVGLSRGRKGEGFPIRRKYAGLRQDDFSRLCPGYLDRRVVNPLVGR